ncbi:hypothetical protein [Nesterenkonia sp. NBAIMH1]|uniref:hypothetical protein n=1 Tax=Nesterenkonia sp. NBAIMH1 TaxID=2600320 RepID=UPI0011B777EC|nr:hypothetical protein [Nesterenkonia sp. NBAIMH1]
MVLVVMSATLATFLRGQLAGLIPEIDDILIAVWAGLFASLFLAAARYLMASRPLQADELTEGLVKDIGLDKWEYISQAAKEHGADGDLLRAIILAEVQQRPRWFRRLERAKGLVFRAGTYGIAQIAASKPISDKESVDRLAESFAGYVVPRTGDHWESVAALRERLMRHNPDAAHIDRITLMYELLGGFTIADDYELTDEE